MNKLPIKLKAFLVSLIAVTVLSITVFVHLKVIPIYFPSFIDIAFFSFFLALAESFIVQFRNVAVSASFAVHLASVILFKPLAAIIIILLGFTFRIVSYNGKYVHILNTPPYKTIYNYCVFIIPTLYGGVAFTILSKVFSSKIIWGDICLLAVFSLVYFLLNTFITSMLFSILNSKSLLYFFKSNARLGLLSSIAMAPFGIILASVFDKYKFVGVLLILCPVILARYTFSLYIQTKNQYVQTVDTLMRAMEARDKYTEGHSQRVGEIATLIAKELKYTDMQIEKLQMASLLHDVGKIGIDDNILNKPGRLTQEEYEIIKSHPEIGYNILKDIKNLEPILYIVRNHHERYDGKGYPDGKTPEELGLDVFIIQLADTIDAMATDRPYRKALSEEDIINEIIKFSGTQFHPKVVQAYLGMIERKKKAV
jgi:putative nucleotidyltransferase with HDIG domain